MQVATRSNSNSSNKLCLLLKTLLFLLCIYIKRVTAAAVSQCEPTPVQDHFIRLTPQTVYQKDVDFELRCPVEFMIERKTSCDNRDSEYLNRLEATIRRRMRCVDILKDNQPFSRESGHNVNFELDDVDNPRIELIKPTVTDQALYTFVVRHNNLTREAKKYFKLYPGAQLDLFVWGDSDSLQDTKPILSDYPVDRYVKRGSDVSFKCIASKTLTSQIIRWFKSPPDTGHNETAIANYLINFKKLQTQTIERGILKSEGYQLEGRNQPELVLLNVSDADIGYYGCMIENSKGYDIRHGRLDFFENVVHLNDYTTLAPRTAPHFAITSAPPTLLDSNLNNINNNIKNDISDSVIETTSGHINSIPNEPNIPRNRFSQSKTNLGHVISTLPSSQDNSKVGVDNRTILAIMIGGFVLVGGLLGWLLINSQKSHQKDKNQSQSNLVVSEPIVGIDRRSDNPKQHLPNGDCPDIYNTGKVLDGFISGHLMQSSNYLMAQSTCNQILDEEKNPSISSSNLNSDEASSWGKSSHGDNSRAFYLHTSNATTTTVPLYDHPPSTGAAQLCGAMVQDACVINPTYGFLRPDFGASEWLFPRRNLERLNKIGEGQFGEVWRYVARQKDGSEELVAVKQLKERIGLGQRERLELLAEIEIMKSVNEHPNVIKLLNYCVEDNQPILLIMEYAVNGKLQTYLRNCRSYRKLYGYSLNDGHIITSKELVTFSYHVAKGMEYIASKGIIHRDLASRNILVSQDKVCKVADFGFARRILDDCAYERTTANPVPVKWMAPEALIENKFTTKSDVYSFGILMWEIVTLGATPYETLNSDQVVKKVRSGSRLEKPKHCKEEFYNIMTDCWRQDPSQRPTFREVASQLEKLVLSETDYIELDQYPEHAYYNIVTNEEKEVVQVAT